MSSAAERRGIDLSSAPEDVQAMLNRIMFLEDERDRYRRAAEVFAHYYDAICDDLKGTNLAYLRARGSLNEHYLAAREALDPSSEQQGDTAHNPADTVPISRKTSNGD